MPAIRGPSSPSESRYLHVGGRDRSYHLYRPPALGRATPVPLVVMLHGGLGTGAQAEYAYRWDEAAGAHGFVVAYPDGVGRTWNAGVCCGPARDANVDDVGFLAALVDTVGAAEGVDADRVYAAGMSNGAMMAYRLACERPDLLAAFGPVAGTLMIDCTDPAPVSVLHIHGTQDHNVPYDGGIGRKAFEPQHRPSVAATLEPWRRAARCGPPRVMDTPPVRTEVATGLGGVEVALITITGAGHQWPGARPAAPRVAAMLRLDPPSPAMDATAALWSFFAAHPRSRMG